MPRCNLTLKQKIQIIDLSSQLSTEELAKKFRVHPSTVTRTLRKKEKIQEHASRVNNNFKTVQTNQRCEEHDTKMLEFMKIKQQAKEPLTIRDICDKALEYAKELNRDIKSKRGWWRRFKVRCNVVRSKLHNNLDSRPVDSEPGNGRVIARKLPGNNADKNYTFKIKETTTIKRCKSTTKTRNKTNGSSEPSEG